jgi:crotonobetainyl-CoA:carnitine CoA-transferase CaiB-like acyl-CoA transferase
VQVLGVPVKLSENEGAVRTSPPTLGQHTAAVLIGDLGVDATRVDALRTAGVI